MLSADDQTGQSGPALAITPSPRADLKSILARYVRQSWRFKCALSAKLLINGDQAFPDMLSAIAAAKETIDLETYIIADDHTGSRFKQALSEAANRGVHVRLLYDHLGGMDVPPAFFEQLAATGIEVRAFHPLVITRPDWAMNRRDHRKILVVDDSISFTGGLNIADDYASISDGGHGWRDTHVRIDGPDIAQVFTSLFEYAWQKATPYPQAHKKTEIWKSRIRRLRRPISLKRLFRKRDSLQMCPASGLAVQIIGNREFRHRRLIHNAYLFAINRAQNYILIENAYFLPDIDIRHALARAVKRGVTVAVVLTRESDVKIISLATRHLYCSLLENGIQIFEWPRSMMHSKTAVIDDCWSIVGSYNFDHRSLLHNLEVAAVIADNGFAQKLRDQTLTDIAKCRQITAQSHRSRPFYQKLLHAAAYLLRQWL